MSTETLRAKTAAVLKGIGLRRRYVGYNYILDVADLLDKGAVIGVPRLQEIAVRRGRTYTQVRRGIQKTAEILYARAKERDSLGVQPESLDVWSFLEYITKKAEESP